MAAYNELQQRLREELQAIEPVVGEALVNANVRDALQALAEALDVTAAREEAHDALLDLKADKSITEHLYQLKADKSITEELYQLKADKAITEDLYQNKADKADLELLRTKDAELEAKIAQQTGLPESEVRRIIGELMNPEVAALRQTDADLDTALKALEARIADQTGLPEAEVRRIIGELISPEVAALRKTDADLDTALKALEARIADQTGLPEAEVRRIIGELISPEVAALRKTDADLDTALKALEARIADQTGLPEAEVRRIIGELMNPEVAALRKTDADLDTALKALEARIADQTGLPEAEVRRIIGELMNPEVAALRKTDADLDTALKALEARIADQTGLPEAEVRRIIGELMNPEVAALRQTDVDLDTALKALEARIADQMGLPESEVRRIIGELMNPEVAALRQTDADLDAAIKSLEVRLAQQTGLPESEVRRIIGELVNPQVIGLQKADADLDLAIKRVEEATTGIHQLIEEKVAAEAAERRIGDANTAAKITPDVWIESAIRMAGDAVAPSIAAATALAAAALPRTDLQPALEAKIGEVVTQQATTDRGQDEKIGILRTDVDALKALPKPLTKPEVLTLVQEDLKDDIEMLVTRINQGKEEAKTNLAKSDAKETEEFGKVRTEVQTEKEQLTKLMDTKIAALDIPTDAEINTSIEAHIDHLRTEVGEKLGQKADKTDIETLRIEFFDKDENGPGTRLARVALLGTGIAGGLELRSDPDNDYIHLTPGVAVMPCSGTLVTESNRLAFSHALPIEDGLGDVFFKKQDGSGYMEIWELLPPENPPAAARSLTDPHPNDPTQSFLSDKVVLLHLRQVVPDGASNVPLVTEGRYVLMYQQDLQERLAGGYPCRNHWSGCDQTRYESPSDIWRCMHPEARLPELSLFRFGFFTDEECAPEDLDKTDFPNLVNTDNFYNTWIPIVDEAIVHIRAAFTGVIEWYHPTLFPLLDKDKFLKALESIEDKWSIFTEYNQHVKPPHRPTKHFAQYFYDWMRDLIAAYHELRRELLCLMADIRTTLPVGDDRFEHLLIGPAYQPDSNGLAPLWRDTFRQPPVYNDNAKRLETSRLYYRRFFKMIEGFYPDAYAPKGVLPDWCTPGEDHDDIVFTKPHFEYLRITPGKGYIHALSQQSIPFYYPLNDNPGSLHHFWQYERTKQLKADHHLSYHANDAEDIPTYSVHREVVRSLHYTLDAYDFYRIEGHIGKSEVALYPVPEGHAAPVYEVVKAIEYLIRKYNLDIKVVKMDITELQSVGPANPPYKIGSGNTEETANSFAEKILGAEHIAGVPKGGTFIVVMEGNTAVADFSLPYRI